MFRRLPDLMADEALTVAIDGRPFVARRGDSVAATLLAAGSDACRTTVVSGVARGPWCMMGACFDCLVVIDGQPNRQGCMVSVEHGMRIETQQGVRAITACPGPCIVAPDPGPGIVVAGSEGSSGPGPGTAP
jgi:hypothetical protein